MVSPFPSHFAVIMTNGRGLKTLLLSTRGPNSLKTYIIFPTSGYFNEAPLIFDTERGEKRFSFLFTVSIRALFSYIYIKNVGYLATDINVCTVVVKYLQLLYYIP